MKSHIECQKKIKYVENNLKKKKRKKQPFISFN